jgi:hypothetical protein
VFGYDAYKMLRECVTALGEMMESPYGDLWSKRMTNELNTDEAYHLAQYGYNLAPTSSDPSLCIELALSPPGVSCQHEKSVRVLLLLRLDF